MEKDAIYKQILSIFALCGNCYVSVATNVATRSI